ncbi:MAG: DNA mismatch repair endonuclease MutL [Planctomycetota bacterium]
MPIRQLPTLVINQIAAGEVIERPASVVKELVENALDAGATHIDVAIEEGGAKLIRVSDDGIGIPEDELTLAVAPHATSKITSADQLEAIGTLGFRGEALASIASVSRLRITSRPTREDGTAEAAGVLEVDGGEVKGPFPGASRPGTVIEVRDLFFNTPARRKFMRSAGSEFGHINDCVQKIAMVNADCGFTLTHNGRKVQDLPRNQTRKDRCVSLMGRDIQDALLEFERTDDPNRGSARVWGLAGMPSLGRATTKFQHVCINGRPVKDRNLQHAIKEAYRGLMPPDRFPQLVAFIDMDPSQVDVNVHPQKSEVRFRNPSHLHGLVLTALRQRLLGADLTPAVGFRSSGLGVGERQEGNTAVLSPPATSESPSPTPNPHIPPPTSFVDYFRKMDPRQKGFVYSEVKRQLKEETPEQVPEEDDAFEEELLSRQAASQDTPNPQPPIPNSHNILQIHDSYVVTQDAQGLVIIDQHALHERVMFEKLRARILDDKETLESQRLLVPEVIRADASRQAALEELQPLLHRLGIEASPIGPSEVAVHAFPSLLFSRNVKVGPFMEELLDKADAGAFDKIELGDLSGGGGTDAQLPEEAALHEVLDMMSCKAAIKAGDKMSDQELASLLEQRDAIERSSNCPHGRPTTLRLTLKDLERQFGRS